MKIVKVFLFLFFILSLSNSCRKEYLGDYDSNYIGTWHSEAFTVPNGTIRENYFTIDGDNSKIGFNCDTNCTGCNCSQFFKDKVVINRKGTTIKFGAYLKEGFTKLDVNEKPYLNSNNIWTCKIDNVVYHRE